MQVKAQSGSTWFEALRLQAPSNQVTQLGDKSFLLETGNGNELANPSFEGSSASPWSTIACTGCTVGQDTISNNAHAGSLNSFKIAATADYSVAFVFQDVTPKGDYKGQLIEHGIWYKTTNMGLLQVCPRQNGATVGVCMPMLNLTGNWDYAYATSMGPTAGTSIGVSVIGTGNMTGTAYIDDGYVGPFRHGLSVAQSGLYGALNYAGTASCSWTTNTAAMLAFSANTNCPAPTVSGNASAPATKIPGITFTSMPPGDYLFIVNSGARCDKGSGNSDCAFELYDGTNSIGTNLSAGGGNTNQPLQTFTGRISYTDLKSNITIQMRGRVSSVTGSPSANIYNDNIGYENFTISVYYFPSISSGTAIQSTNSMRAPTYTILTSGSGTYTVPQGVSRLEIEMSGGGGGGGPSGSGGGTATDGGNTTFGTSLLTANGGGKGAYNGPIVTGGTVTVNAPAVAVVASTGGTSGPAEQARAYGFGGVGGSNQLSGANGASIAVAGSGGRYGGGGGGGGAGATSVITGAGGAAGGYIKAYIDAPSASYSYSVGSGGSGGTAGTNGSAGGAGGFGIIIIKEIYGVNVPPMKAGVISPGSNVTSVVSAVISNGGSCAIVQGSSWISSVSHPATGNCLLTIKSGVFSQEPACTCIPRFGSSSAAGACVQVTGGTATSEQFSTSVSGTVADNGFNVVCVGQ